MIDQYQQHIDRLLDELQSSRSPDDSLSVHWIDNNVQHEAQALHDEDGTVNELHLPVIRSDSDYAICLHEIGHILGRQQNSDDIPKVERGAWTWARKNAIAWTDEMEQEARASMRHYRALQSRSHDRA